MRKPPSRLVTTPGGDGADRAHSAEHSRRGPLQSLDVDLPHVEDGGHGPLGPLRTGGWDATPSPAVGRRPTASPSSTWSASGEFDTTNKNWYLPPIEWENHYRRPRPQPSGCDPILLGEATPTPRRCGPAPRPAPPTAGPMRSPAPRRPGGCGCAGWRRPDRPWFPGGPAPAATSGRRCATLLPSRQKWRDEAPHRVGGLRAPC